MWRRAESGAMLAFAAMLAAGCGSGGTHRETAPECQAAAEVCNGQDDDCNGAVDDGIAAITCGTGACAVTVAGCVSGAVPACVPGTPAAETCNGVDDDCDGGVDEGCECVPDAERSCYPGPSGTAGVGACRAGTQRCEAGHWASCTGAQTPAAETCNGVDDDCDGTTDEDVCRWTGVKRVALPTTDALAGLALDADGAVHATIASSTALANHRGRHLTLRLVAWDAAGRDLPAHAFEADEDANLLERVETLRDAAGNTWALLSSWKWPHVELLKLDRSAKLLWQVEAFPWNQPYEPHLAVDPSGIASVTLWTGMEGGWELRTFGSDGALVRNVAIPPNHVPTAIAVDTAGTVTLGGTSSAVNGSGDAFVARLAPDGGLAWEAGVGYDGTPGAAQPSGSVRHLALGPSGDVSAVGRIDTYTYPPTDETFLARWSETGAPRWLRRYDALDAGAPGQDALAVGPDDGLWAGDHAGDPGARTAWVERYDATGARLWRVELGAISENLGGTDVVVGPGGEAWAGSDRVFPGAAAGDTDVFVAKVSPDGVVQ